MYFVYLLQSVHSPHKRYVGYSTNFEQRFEQHNSGFVALTKNHVPWEVKVLVQFDNEQKAKAFERYLKHGSGHAFAKRHFW